MKAIDVDNEFLEKEFDFGKTIKNPYDKEYREKKNINVRKDIKLNKGAEFSKNKIDIQ